MDRVILGKAPANTQPYYHRDNEYGLFISKPGANVYNCADGDLIFDSTKPSLMQPIGRGAANIPKAVYEKGLFGEEGVINDGNWDSPGSGPEELNADTSWAFDALKKVYSEVQDMKNNTFGDMDSSEGSYGGPPLYETNVNMESAKFQQFIRFTNDYKQRDPFKTTFKDFPDIGADEFVRTMIKDIWRIYDVFPFLHQETDINPLGSRGASPILETIPSLFWRDSVLFQSTPTTYPDGSSTVGVRLIQYTPDIFYSSFLGKLPFLTPLKVAYLADTIYSDVTLSSGAPYYYDGFKIHFQPANFTETVYNKIGYSAANPFSQNFPMVWRAWTTPESGPFTQAQELAAIKKWYTYMFIFKWMYTTFAKQVDDGLLDYSFFKQDRPFPYQGGPPDAFVFDFGFSYGYVNILNIRTLCPSSATSFDQYKSYNNRIGYSKWSGGSVDVNTGISPADETPVQIWWESILKGTSNTTTNLPFLNDSRNRIKTPDEAKRQYVSVPGISSIHANTYMENGVVYIRFSQPSTLDETQIFYTAYKEPAWDGFVPVVIGKGAAPPNFSDQYVLDIRDQSDGGNNLAGRKAADGRYYTVVFPDDFVGTRNTATDPFANNRDSSGRISQALFITLSVAEGVVLSGNSYFNHITADELRTGTSYAGDAHFGPLDSAGRSTTEVFAANDPCIKLNLHSNEFTDDALAGLNVVVENRGTIIGAGGWGSYGQMNSVDDKYQKNYPGGGGGGGQGYHPTLVSENQAAWHGSYTAPPTEITGAIQGDAEIASVTESVSTNWDGPTSYVEWGIGGNGGYSPGGSPFDANTQYTGLDYITWKSIGPGKAGTGYLGATPSGVSSQPTGSNLYDYPYGRDALVPDGQNRLSGKENIWDRLAGTYQYNTGEPRFNPAGWGENGVPGKTTAPGAGGAERITTTFGYNQDPILRIKYDDVGDTLSGVNLGQPSSGSGGSCVYLYSNTQSQISGTSVRLVNMPTGIIKSGGGGGSGGSSVPGLGGGKLGRPGRHSSATTLNTSYITNSSEANWNEYSRRGEPGKLVWWNSPNITRNYAIENNSTRTDGAIEGIDYNPVIGGEDYVSYAPAITLSLGTQTQGDVHWSRTLVKGSLVYDSILERTYEEYINSSDTPEGFVK